MIINYSRLLMLGTMMLSTATMAGQELVIGKADKQGFTHVYVLHNGKPKWVKKRINLNRASRRDLEAAGMSQKLAEAITQHRQHHGRFKNLHSLSDVAAYRDLTEEQKARLKEQVRV